jgi:hypothetical protein
MYKGERIAAIIKISFSYVLNDWIEILLHITSLPPKYCTMQMGLCCVVEAYGICVLSKKVLEKHYTVVASECDDNMPQNPRYG